MRAPAWKRPFLRAIASLCATVAATSAHADGKKDPSFLEDAGAAKRLASAAPGIALLEGAWSAAEWAASFAISRRWDSPRGYAPQIFTRVLYGTTWTIMQGIESGLAVAVAGDFTWADRARYRTQWFLGTHVPAGCSHIGAEGGCGLGTGSFSSLGFRMRDSNVWLRNDGGWLESRVSTNQRRTLEESTFALIPLEVLYELETHDRVTGPTQGIAASVRGGGALLLGLHQAHVHPRPAFVDAYPKSFTEMAFLDAGLGIGATVEARVDFGRYASIFGQARFIPLPAGGVRKDVEPETERLGTDRPGDFVVFRQFSFGVSHLFPSAALDLGVGYYAMELSGRRVTNIGHGAIMMQLEYTLPIALKKESRLADD